MRLSTFSALKKKEGGLCNIRSLKLKNTLKAKTWTYTIIQCTQNGRNSKSSPVGGEGETVPLPQRLPEAAGNSHPPSSGPCPSTCDSGPLTSKNCTDKMSRACVRGTGNAV